MPSFGIERLIILQTILFIFSDLCGLGVFARDIPILTGVRSAPYEDLFSLLAIEPFDVAARFDLAQQTAIDKFLRVNAAHARVRFRDLS